jgi:hypothetical protein
VDHSKRYETKKNSQVERAIHLKIHSQGEKKETEPVHYEKKDDMYARRKNNTFPKKKKIEEKPDDDMGDETGDERVR